MTFTNRLGKCSIGFGNPISNDSLFLSQNNALSGTGETKIALSGFSPTVQHGQIRVKVSAGTGTSPTVVSVRIVVTDGTNSEEVYSFNPATAFAISSTAALDLLSHFLSELSVTEVDVYVTLGGSSPGATCDVEVAASN